MLFNRYVIFGKIFINTSREEKSFNIEGNNKVNKIKKYKNQPGYALLPTNSYLKVDRKGRLILVENPRRWKRILDKDKKISNKNYFVYGIKNFYVEELGKIDISIELSQNNNIINFKNNAYKVNKIELDDFNTNPYNLPKILKSIEKEDGIIFRNKYVENLIANIVIRGNDEIKLNYLDYFISEDYIRDFNEEIYNMMQSDAIYTPIPTYRHFLQLFLSLDDIKILENDKLYRDFFKSLLILDWVQDRAYYSSVLESLLFYGIKLFGKKVINKITGLNEKFLDDITKFKKVPVPLLNVKKKNFLNALSIIREMYQETQDMIDKFIENDKLTKLYRGSVIYLKPDKENDLINKFMNIYKNIKKEKELNNEDNIKNYIFNLFNKDKDTKLIESWTSDINIAKHFSKLNDENRYIDLINIINNYSEDEFKSFIENYVRKNLTTLKIGIVFEIDAKENRDLLKRSLFLYNSFYKYWQSIKEIQNSLRYLLTGKRTKETLTLVRALPATIALDNEKEFGFLIGIQKELKPDNIKIGGIIL